MSGVLPGRGASPLLRQIDATSTGAEGIASATAPQSGRSAANAKNDFRVARFTDVSVQCAARPGTPGLSAVRRTAGIP